MVDCFVTVHCWLIVFMLKIPSKVALLLTDPNVKKVGKGIAGDAARLHRDTGLDIPKESLVDIAQQCKQAGNLRSCFEFSVYFSYRLYARVHVYTQG